MLSEPLIQFTNVSKRYTKGAGQHGTLRDEIMAMISKKRNDNSLKKDEFWALRNVSFQVDKGQSMGLYGHNGSGKSTILKLIANIITPTGGRVKTYGRVAPLIELGAGFHPDLNGIENIYMNGAILGMTIREIKGKTAAIIDYSGLGDFIDTPVKKYSSGMKLRLGFSVAIHSDADIFLFDEILAIGDEEFNIKCIQSIKELPQKNKTLVIVSHDMKILNDVTDKILYLKKGTIITK